MRYNYSFFLVLVSMFSRVIAQQNRYKMPSREGIQSNLVDFSCPRDLKSLIASSLGGKVFSKEAAKKFLFFSYSEYVRLQSVDVSDNRVRDSNSYDIDELFNNIWCCAILLSEEHKK